MVGVNQEPLVWPSGDSVHSPSKFLRKLHPHCTPEGGLRVSTAQQVPDLGSEVPHPLLTMLPDSTCSSLAQGQGARSLQTASEIPFGACYPLCLEKEMATHSSILAWRIPWTEEPGGLQSMRLQRVRHG